MEESVGFRFPSEPRQRICISSYSFREFIVGEHHKSGNPSIDLLDFAAHVVERFNVNKIEPWSRHFPSTDAKYLKDFRKAVENAGAAIVNMTVSGKDSAYSADRDETGENNCKLQKMGRRGSRPWLTQHSDRCCSR